MNNRDKKHVQLKSKLMGKFKLSKDYESECKTCSEAEAKPPRQSFIAYLFMQSLCLFAEERMVPMIKMRFSYENRSMWTTYHFRGETLE